MSRASDGTSTISGSAPASRVSDSWRSRLPGPNADWQTILPDGTALGDIRYTLATSDGVLLAVRSKSIRHGSPEVLARLARGEEVDASEYTFRTTTQIETASPELEWLNQGIFVSVGGRLPGGVVYETYLVA